MLRCFKDDGRILIVDDFSTDKIVEIARNYGADDMAKTWEIENNVTLETIEQKYDKLKEELLKK